MVVLENRVANGAQLFPHPQRISTATSTGFVPRCNFLTMLAPQLNDKVMTTEPVFELRPCRVSRLNPDARYHRLTQKSIRLLNTSTFLYESKGFSAIARARWKEAIGDEKWFLCMTHQIGV